jgi:phosphatidate cytidylyltransferase
MSKIIQRLLVFIIGLPAVLSVVFFFPFMNHLAANCVVVVASSLGALEFSGMVSKRGYSLPAWEAALLGGLLPFGAMLRVSFGLNGEWELYAIVLTGLWILSSRIFSSNAELSPVMDRVTSAFATLLYPGALMLWIVRMNADPHATALLLLFLLMVFGNDSVAWASGMLFGAGNRGMVPASPNKSLAGFIGGLLTAVAVGAVAPLILPSVFGGSRLPAVIAGGLLGLLCGLGTIIGDLAESTMKRSADVKDSGMLIPGRGGLLDSIDSIAFSAPVFLAAFTILFRQ